MQRPHPESYINRIEYKERVPIIQTAMFEALEDKETNGGQGIEATMVVGSYGKSYFTKDPKVLVHEWKSWLPGSGDSDLDVIHFNSDPKWIGRARDPFNLFLERNLAVLELAVRVENWGDVELTRPKRREVRFLSGRYRGALKFESGLLFMPEECTRREAIFAICRESGLKVVVNPATEATIL
jgi:hypothetical protein